jgi:cyanate permease
MAQTVGYIVASLGPLALGALRALPKADLTSLAFLLLLTVLTMVFGLLAGRPVFVDDAGTRNG